MKGLLIKNALIVNEGSTAMRDVLISHGRIARIDAAITCKSLVTTFDATGLYLLPGVIDAHVHFREPGLTWKGTIRSESMAALAGGITSYMDMPNTRPAPLTQDLLEQKFRLAAEKSWCNYSFFMGLSKDNLEQALRTDPKNVCGLSDDGLYFTDEDGLLVNHHQYLEQLFSRTGILVALHSESDSIIRQNTEKFKGIFGPDIPVSYHPLIRSTQACTEATAALLTIARRHDARLHLLHTSTAQEAQMLGNQQLTGEKRITAEVCIHHLYFSDADYIALGNKIKWNPAIKSACDKEGLIEALKEGRIDTIATDHAPHLLSEKKGNYFEAAPGGPMVQHALPAMLEFCRNGELAIEQVVEKMAHNVAAIYRIPERGYIREGYWADLVLVDLNSPSQVSRGNLRYRCGWSPFEGRTFHSKIIMAIVNGVPGYHNGKFLGNPQGRRLQFNKI